MTKETYTPGPHHVVIGFAGNYVKTEDKTIVCTCRRMEDAALHAAASDLLRQLKIEHYSNCLTVNSAPDCAEALAEHQRNEPDCEACAAIAKAKLENSLL